MTFSNDTHRGLRLSSVLLLQLTNLTFQARMETNPLKALSLGQGDVTSFYSYQFVLTVLPFALHIIPIFCAIKLASERPLGITHPEVKAVNIFSVRLIMHISF